MDFFTRRSRDRQLEEVAHQRLAESDRQRDRARLIGYVDDDRASRRALLTFVLIALVTTLVVVLYLQLGPSAVEPSVEHPVVADKPAQGSATHASTRVQPPTWWSAEPP